MGHKVRKAFEEAMEKLASTGFINAAKRFDNDWQDLMRRVPSIKGGDEFDEYDKLERYMIDDLRSTLAVMGDMLTELHEKKRGQTFSYSEGDRNNLRGYARKLRQL